MPNSFSHRQGFLRNTLLSLLFFFLTIPDLKAEDLVTPLMKWSDGSLGVALIKGSSPTDPYLVQFSGPKLSLRSVNVKRSQEGSSEQTLEVVFSNHQTSSKSSMQLDNAEQLRDIKIEGSGEGTKILFTVEAEKAVSPQWKSDEQILAIHTEAKSLDPTPRVSATSQSMTPTKEMNEEEEESSPKAVPPPVVVASRYIEQSPKESVAIQEEAPLLVEDPIIEKEEIAGVTLPEEEKEDARDKPINPDALTLKKLQFIFEEDSESLSLELSQWPEYRLSQVKDGQFLLTIGDCSIEKESVTLPIFAPTTSKYFAYAVAKESNEGVRVSIQVESKVKLNSRVVGTKLVLNAEKESAS